jgi:deazaflavin-dependent oxidoreductase (nitroreductase family)
MTKTSYPPFQSLVQKFAASRFGSWFGSVALHHLDVLSLKLTRGRSTMTRIVSGLPVVILTTVGAKSGLPRTVPLLDIRDEVDPTVFAFIATNWGQSHHPAWYFNLKANPRAICSIGGQSGEYLAHEASGEEYERFWRYATRMYAGYTRYKQRAVIRRIPIMVMTPLTP